ncbi:MAG: c-type cytochrome biogenesis protein CcmI [Hyphomicrobiaceae bacterium]
MVLFWLICAAMTALGVVLIVRPMVGQSPSEGPPKQADIAVYKDQLGEIDKDLDRGILGAEEAEAARVEVARRILALDAKQETSHQAGSLDQSQCRRSNVGVATVASVIIVSCAVGGYLAFGSPGQPARPHAPRVAADPSKLPVDELIARVEARLQQQPDDAKGWDVIAPVYLRRQKFEKAAYAYQRAIALNGESPRRLAQFAESVLGATHGLVTGDVKRAYERLLMLKADYLPAHFWLSVWHEQQGDTDSAAAAYRKLSARNDLPAAMRGMIDERLNGLDAKQLKPPSGVRSNDVIETVPDGSEGSAAVGQESSARSRTPAPSGGLSSSRSSGEAKPVGKTNDGRVPNPSKEARQDLMKLAPEQRVQRIRGMVDGLARRLYADGGDLEDWQRLIRSYLVLGDRSKASEAASKAKASFAHSPDAARSLENFIGQLGL